MTTAVLVLVAALTGLWLTLYIHFGDQWRARRDLRFSGLRRVLRRLTPHGHAPIRVIDRVHVDDVSIDACGINSRMTVEAAHLECRRCGKWLAEA